MGLGHTCGVKVLRIDRPDGRRVLKFDGASGPEGCGLPLCGNAYKVSVTDLLSVSYGMISITSISHLRWLFFPPLVPYGTTKRDAFPRPQGDCMVLYKLAPSII